MSKLPDVRPWSAQGLAIVLIVAAAFVCSHPYTGVRHDGTLYLGDALARLLPGQFRDDLYFLFGSQGRFTLLPAAYAALIAVFGVGGGTIAGLLLAFALYLAATWALVARLAPPPWRAVCVLSVVLGWTLYGGNRIFGYSEPFLTARSFAEPAVLFALALLMRGRLVATGVALAIAVVIHPLIAAGGCLAAWVFVALGDRRWWWAAPVGGVVLAALGFAGAGPFSDVFARYDADWLALVHEANGHAFVLRWTMPDYGVLAFDAAVLWFAIRGTDDPLQRRFAIALLVAGLGATLASLVLVDVVGNPFFGKLQIWRAEWVMQWLAMAVFPLVVARLWRRDAHGRVAAGFLAIGWMAPFSIVPAPLAAMAIAIDAGRSRFVVGRTTTRIVVVAAICAAIAIIGQYEARVVKLGALLDQPLHGIVAQALTMNLAVLLVALAVVAFAVPRLGRLAPVLGVALLAGALFYWDQRPTWTQKLESYPVGTHIWPGLIEPEAKVYWYRDLIAPWVLLGHGNYYTQQQGSGAVFSRDMVVELDRRRKVTAILDFQEQICRMMNNLSEKQGSCEPDAEAVRLVCVDGGIDYVVLQSSLEGARPIAEYTTNVVENGYEKKFFLYRCATLKPR